MSAQRPQKICMSFHTVQWVQCPMATPLFGGQGQFSPSMFPLGISASLIYTDKVVYGWP